MVARCSLAVTKCIMKVERIWEGGKATDITANSNISTAVLFTNAENPYARVMSMLNICSPVS